MRSLSETGATIVVAGAFENGTVFISNARASHLTSAVVIASLVLIVSSLAVFALIKIITPRIRIAPLRVWPNLERTLSKSPVVSAEKRDQPGSFSGIRPSSMPFHRPAGNTGSGWRDGNRGPCGGRALEILLVEYAPILCGCCASDNREHRIRIAGGYSDCGNRFGTRLGRVIDALVDLPIIVPSLALGVSLNFFWRNMGALPEFWVIVLAHTTITYSYFVRTMAASIQGIAPELEDAAKTLGAMPLRVFRKITVPLTKYSLLSGAILVFTRSVDETGATSAVATTLQTAPILLVSWIRGVVPVTPAERALGVGFLVATSFLALVMLRLVSIRHPTRKVA